MKQDATSDPNATQTASPSTAEPASTIEPTPGARPTHHRPSAASQLRDPDRYQIINEHGRGGLGRVSRAHDRDLGRDVAIKELISRGTLSEVRFLREALITARLEHPGIVPVHEAGRWPDGTPFYAMKLVAGRPLRDLIQERTTVAERIGLLHHVIAVADAIAYAHGRNIIHRDLKPANVIVGDFGETIVIDWGLAKDLSTASEATLGGGPFRANRDDDLTAVGSVLGTPAYMAPEQERGEYVDQRADVFAIGAMLWELCSLQKVPPSDQQLRHRLLRRAAIDQDLVTIIDKSLDPDPTRRYPNAGALAADLKAFKAGARISARSYSLAAMFAHWIRRRRGAAIAIACVLGILLAGAALYVRNINIERGLADAAKATADNANTVTTIALAEQTLGHAEVLLSSDPSAANDLLNSYKGKDDFRLGMLRAQANGLGVARLRATPNTDSVLWIHVLQDQSLATLSNDGSVAVTTATGAVRIIKHEAGARSVWTFSESRQLLAYVCSENQICLIDFSHASPSLAGRLNYSDPEGLAFSPDSKRLAIVSRTEHLEVWDLSKLDIPFQLFRARAHGFNASFIDIDTLVAVDEQTSTIISGSRITNTIPTPDASNTASSIEHNAIAIGTGRGMAIMIRRELKPTIIPVKLCDGPLKTLAFTSDANIIAYGCKDGRIGLWHVDSLILDPLTVVPGGISELAVSWDSRYLAVGGNSGALSIVSLDSGIITRCLGHSGRISAIEPLVRDGLFASGDFNGNIRIWDKPLSLGRVAYIAKSRLIDVQFLFDSSALVTTGVDTAIRFVSDKSTQNVASHGPNNKFLAVAPGG
ncbi:MAG: WD40 repeat domain-containing serine/threonine protein kinase, partial [Kofleriaceae bacterium]